MNPIQYIIEQIDQSDVQTFKKYIFFYIMILISIIGTIYGIFYFKKNNLIEKYKILKEKKKVVDTITLQKNDILGKKKLFDSLLKNKETFRLKDYVYSGLQKSNLFKYLIINNETISEQKLNQDYIEFSITLEFSQVSTEEALYILSVLENDERVYIKQINIKNNNKKLSFNVTLATIQLIKI
jgi:hypothetical protein